MATSVFLCGQEYWRNKLAYTFLGSNICYPSTRAKFISAEETTGVTFDDFAGQEYIKRELQEIVRILKNDEEYQNKGIYCPKGVLLHGPPGTGKTLLAKAIAGEAGVPFFAANGTDFVEVTPDSLTKYKKSRKIMKDGCEVFLLPYFILFPGTINIALDLWSMMSAVVPVEGTHFFFISSRQSWPSLFSVME